MIRKIYINNKWIDVESNYELKGCKISYKGRFIKPEKIEIECDKCGVMFTKNYIRRNISLCRSCCKKQTNLEKYGDENYLNHSKAKQTNLEKYGSTSALHGTNQQKIDEIKKSKYGTINNHSKAKQTNLEKYGVEYSTQTNVMKSSSQRTKLEKYGDPFYTNREKAKQTCKNLFGSENIFGSTELIEKHRKEIFFKLYNSNVFSNSVIPLFSEAQYKTSHSKYSWKCKSCSTKFEDFISLGRVPRCPICFPKLAGVSLLKSEFFNWLKTLNIKVIENYDIKTTKLNFYIPEHNLAIDFDSIYWNSELNNRNRNYHLQKTILCEKANIKLLHVFEDEWLDKNEIVKSIIKSKLKLFDREIDVNLCTHREISSELAELFLNKNNLFGYVKSKINIGMFFNEDLVSVLSANHYEKDVWEIVRFCSSINTKISSFNEMIFEKMIFYVDRRYFSGSSLNMIEIKQTLPVYWYVKNRLRHNRKEFRKYKLSEILEKYDPNITEWQNMQLNGYDRIWDCGTRVFYSSSQSDINNP